MQSPSSRQWNYIDLFQWNSIVFQWSFIDCINGIQLICWIWKKNKGITLSFQWNSIDLFNGCPFICSIISNRLFYFEKTIEFRCVSIAFHCVFQWNSIVLLCSIVFCFIVFWTWTNQWHCIVVFFQSNSIVCFDWIPWFLVFNCIPLIFEFENTSMEFNCF